MSIFVPNSFGPAAVDVLCMLLLYNGSSDFVRCNKYFNIMTGLTRGFIADHFYRQRHSLSRVRFKRRGK